MDITGGLGELTTQVILPSRPIPTLADDVRELLLGSPRSLPPKYLYDEAGSDLFDQICRTKDYYVTRTEDALLTEVVGNVAATVRPATVFEFGSGMSRKTPQIIDACCQVGPLATYAAFDISPDALRAGGEGLRQSHPEMSVQLFVGDYTAGLDALPVPEGPRLFLFLGGTIGNFTEPEGIRFLRDLAAKMEPGDFLLMGADRIKDRQVLHDAYNDSEGLTAAFNQNVLRVLNARLGADFEPEAFRHDAVYSEQNAQIEMRLVAMQPQTVTFNSLDEQIRFDRGESILTEVSRKFSRDSLERLVRSAGFKLRRHYTTDDEYFSLVLAEIGNVDERL